jgi:hypothetical protein
MRKSSIKPASLGWRKPLPLQKHPRRLQFAALIAPMHNISASEIGGVLLSFPRSFHDVHRVFGSSAQLYLDRRQSAIQIIASFGLIADIYSLQISVDFS